jgi:uncharacterized repeat protein (TIGR01451 family)
MKLQSLAFMALLVAWSSGSARGQMARSARPPMGPPPLLFVRLDGPAGMQATFFQGNSAGQVSALPTVIGLRPGYIYRMKLSGLPQLHGDALYPTFEVRGMVALAPGLNGANFPVPVTFAKNEIDRALGGAFFTKVFYLEHPDRAEPIATQPGQILETEAPPGLDPIAAARERGRLVLIVRFGERQVETEEMVHQAIPGTMLLPGDKTLPPAQRPPCLSWSCWPVYDPILGPRPPKEECLQDGGDVGVRAGIGPDGRLFGLDPTDTVAEYSDSKTKRHVAISNRVCLFAPRFVALRAEVAPGIYNGLAAANQRQTTTLQTQLASRQPIYENRQAEQLQAFRGRENTSGIETAKGPIAVEQFEGLALAHGRMKGRDVVATCRQEKAQPPDRPLVLCKFADKAAVRVGDVVTFHLKYTNQGGQPISDIAVSDSLSGRLEYLPGSAKIDREAVFTTQQNDAGSVILRWEIAGQLLPGQSGLISFQAKVR